MTPLTVVRATMIVATIVWAIGEVMMRRSATHNRSARAIWTLGVLLTVVHVVLAFQFVYAWDHEAAIAATVQQTADRFGRGWRGGIYVNYLFITIWLADACWWWILPASHVTRPTWINRARLAFFIFMFVNGAIIFASGIGRLVGIAAVTLVVVTALRGTRMTAHRIALAIAVPLLLMGTSCTPSTPSRPDSAIAEMNRSQCRRDGSTYLQVLGSGGPMHADGRGGSAYALWLSDRPAIVVDMGGDTPTALARAGAMPASVEVLLISHLHADHVSGLADFLWGEAASERHEALAIAGPDSNNQNFPSLPVFLDRLIGEDGTFPTMKGLHAGAPFALQVTTLPVADPAPQRVLEHRGITITALSVPHGAAPALAYRLEGPHVSVVFAGDQSGLHPHFAEFASGVDLLIFHATVNDRAKDQRLAGSVGIPSRLGELARASGAKRVMLSHLMGQPGDSEQATRWSLSDIKGVVESVRHAYQGPVTLASDFACIAL